MEQKKNSYTLENNLEIYGKFEHAHTYNFLSGMDNWAVLLNQYHCIQPCAL